MSTTAIILLSLVAGWSVYLGVVAYVLCRKPKAKKIKAPLVAHAASEVY